jgi:hypothetical protein
LLVQPFVGGDFIAPRDPKIFVHTPQAQVFYVALPIWNNPIFFHCSSSLITFVVFIVTHVYSAIGDAKESRNSIPESIG